MKRTVLTVAAAGLAAISLAACGGGGGNGDGGSTDGGDSSSTEEAAGGNADCTGTTADKVFKLAFNQTEQHPQYVAAVELGNKLAEATDCRYGIQAYANEQLGSQADVVNDISAGAVEMMYIGGPVMEGFNPDFIVFNLPYMFDSIEAQQEVFENTEALAELFSSLEDTKNITVLGALHSGVRNVYNSVRPITKPADLDGLKIRVQQSDSQVKMIELMGGVASPMGQGEVYGALQTGVLDGAENNPTVYNALKHDEVAGYYSGTAHLLIPDYLLINTEVLASMGDDEQVFLDLVSEAILDANTGFIEFAAESQAASEEAGAVFNTDDVDVAAFKEAVQPLIDESINNPVRESLYELVQQANEAHPAK